MSRFQFYTGKLILMFFAIVIGIPLGILTGILYFFRVTIDYPFRMYQLANKQWTRKIELDQADMWTRHIARMEEKSRTNQDINNN